MALSDAQAYEGDGSTRDFSILGEIPSESHLRVWIDDVLQSSDSWDLLGNTVLFDTAPTDGTSIQFIVSTTGTDFPTSPSDISEVAASIINVNKVADNIGNVDIVADNMDDVNTVNSNINNVNTVATNMIDVNTVATNIIDVNTIVDNLTDVITTSDNIGVINITSNDIANINIVAKYIQEGNASIGSNGQLLGNSVIKGVAYLANSTNENLTVLSGTNGYSVDSLTLNDGATITVENNAVYKIL